MSQASWEFANRTVLVTGAAGAIGAGTARLFHAAKANVVLADSDLSRLQALSRELDGAATGQRVIAIQYDALRPADAARVVAQATGHFGALHFVVPAAGIYPESAFVDIAPQDWERTLRINLDGVFHLCRAAAPEMPAGGAIVTIASIAAHRGSAGHAHYAASKGGVLALTRSMARELAPRIRVNAVSPGIIATPMVESLLRAQGDSLRAQTPLGRFGDPREVASVIAFLCSDAASFITGETIHVNGGLLIS